MNALKSFLVDESGFTGAEKALVTLLALGGIIVVAKLIYTGSSTASTTVENKLSSQTMPENQTWK